MKVPELLELLKRITYKPGFRITVDPSIPYAVGFQFSHQVPNADRKYAVETGFTGKGGFGYGDFYETVPTDVLYSELPSHATVGRSESLDYGLLEHMNEQDLLRWLFQQIDILEDHEQEEFFKVDGKHFIDPHPEKAAK